MKKPRSFCVKDSWNQEGAWIFAELGFTDSSDLCVKIDLQGDVETKDLWLNAKDVEKLANRLMNLAKYLKEKGE